MPHESTVGHDPKHRPEKLTWASRARTVGSEEDSHQSRRDRLTRTESLVPNLFADTPREITQIHENHEEDFKASDKQSSDESDTETTETVM